MTDLLQDVFSGVTATEPEDVGDLQVFGLRWTPPASVDYVTLGEALEQGRIEVVEVNEAGNVPNLKVVNRGDQQVLLLAGEILVGAKQNRVLNASMMVPARSDLVVPVSCIEQGRWSYQSRKFAHGDEFVHGHLKGRILASTHESYRKKGYPGSDQGAVWHEVQRKLRAMKSASPSADLHQVYLDRRRVLDEALGALQLPDDCTGAAFAFGGQVAGVTLFDRPATLQKVLRKLARAYALDALEHAENPDEPALGASDVAAWIHRGMRAPLERFSSPGIGDDVRLQSDTHVGACLLVEQTPVHTEIFAEAR